MSMRERERKLKLTLTQPSRFYTEYKLSEGEMEKHYERRKLVVVVESESQLCVHLLRAICSLLCRIRHWF